MNDNATRRARLCAAVGDALDRFAKQNPDLDVIEVCGALGTAAGVTVGMHIPPNCQSVDHLTALVLVRCFEEAVAVVRADKG